MLNYEVWSHNMGIALFIKSLFVHVYVWVVYVSSGAHLHVYDEHWQPQGLVLAFQFVWDAGYVVSVLCKSVDFPLYGRGTQITNAHSSTRIFPALHEFWIPKFKFSHLRGKHFTHWVIVSPAKMGVTLQEMGGRWLAVWGNICLKGTGGKKETVKETWSYKSGTDENQGQEVTWRCWRQYPRRKNWLTVSNLWKDENWQEITESDILDYL